MIQLIPDFDCAVPENKQALRRLLAESWAETYPQELGAEIAAAMIARLESEDLCGILSAAEGARVLGALKDGELLGVCLSAERPDGALWFWGFYLRRSAQRQGLGRRMLAQILRGASAPMPLRAYVLRASQGALRFYKALGFRALERTRLETAPGVYAPALIVEWRPKAER